MTRHGKNATASAVYSYSERRKDEKQSGYGTLHERLGADAIKGFDCCSLTLQPCREPMVSPDGFLFDKEAILEYIVNQKKENKRKLAEYQRQLERDEVEKVDEAQKADDAKVAKFALTEGTPAHVGSFYNEEKELIAAEQAINAVKSTNGKNEPTTSAGVRKRASSSFWAPSDHVDTKKTRVELPDSRILCPVTKKPLKMKDLITVKFTKLPHDDGDKQQMAGKQIRYMCPVTHDILTNTTKCCVLKTTGDVITQDCVDNIIKKDWLHPLTAEPITQDDIITLQRGGTGYAAANKEQLKANLARPVMHIQ